MYQPLETPSTLRLIRVLPDLLEGRIVCEMRTADPRVSRDVVYDALSYCWGNREIFLEDMKTGQKYLWPIHENLWQFLHQVQDQRLSDVLIWVDRLCLNQGDAQEIRQQVPRMRDIYSQAEIALMWLGADEDGSSPMEHITVDYGKKPIEV